MTTLNPNRHETTNLPRRLTFAGGSMTLAGPSRAPGASAYVDPTTQQVHDVFVGITKRTGPLYSLVEVPGNQALGLIRIDDHSFGSAVALTPGQRVLVAGIANQPNGPRANSAWLVLAPKPAPSPTPQRRVPVTRPTGGPRRFTGRITAVAACGTFGFIQPSVGSAIFVHASAFGGGVHLVVGETVSYAIGSNSKGPAAIAVRPA